MDQKETGYWWLRLLGSLHTILGAILLVVAAVAIVVALRDANRSDFYGTIAPYVLLCAAGVAVGGVATIGMGQAHKALADIADNSHGLSGLLAELRGGERNPDPALDLPSIPTLTPTGHPSVTPEVPQPGVRDEAYML